MLLLDVLHHKGPELHLDLSISQRTMLHLDMSTPQGPELHLNFFGQQKPVLILDVLHHRVLMLFLPSKVNSWI